MQRLFASTLRRFAVPRVTGVSKGLAQFREVASLHTHAARHLHPLSATTFATAELQQLLAHVATHMPAYSAERKRRDVRQQREAERQQLRSLSEMLEDIPNESPLTLAQVQRWLAHVAASQSAQSRVFGLIECAARVLKPHFDSTQPIGHVRAVLTTQTGRVGVDGRILEDAPSTSADGDTQTVAHSLARMITSYALATAHQEHSAEQKRSLVMLTRMLTDHWLTLMEDEASLQAHAAAGVSSEIDSTASAPAKAESLRMESLLHELMNFAWSLVVLQLEDDFIIHFLRTLTQWLDRNLRFDSSMSRVNKQFLKVFFRGNSVHDRRDLHHQAHQICIHLQLYDAAHPAVAAASPRNFSPRTQKILWRMKKGPRNKVNVSQWNLMVIQLLRKPTGSMAFVQKESSHTLAAANQQLQEMLQQEWEESMSVGKDKTAGTASVGPSPSPRPDLQFHPLTAASSPSFPSAPRVYFVTEHTSELGYVIDVALAKEEVKANKSASLPSSVPASISTQAAINRAVPRVCLEMNGPDHYMRASVKVMRAHHCVKLRQMEAAGWKVISVPYFTWNELRGAEAQERWLKKHIDAAFETGEKNTK